MLTILMAFSVSKECDGATQTTQILQYKIDYRSSFFFIFQTKLMTLYHIIAQRSLHETIDRATFVYINSSIIIIYDEIVMLAYCMHPK